MAGVDGAPNWDEEAQARAQAAVLAGDPFARLAARLPPHWHVCIATCALVFAGHLLYGANTDAAAMSLAALWLVFGAIMTAAPDASRPARPRPLLILAGVCFVGVLAVGVSQLLPTGAAHAGALWQGVDGPAAITIDRDATLRELFKLVSLAAAFSVGMSLGASDLRVRFFVFLMVVASGIYGAWAFLQHFVDIGHVMGLEKPYHADRLTASFLSANNAATTLGIFAVIAAARLARAVKESTGGGYGRGVFLDRISRKGFLPGGVLLMLLTCVLATQSRAGVAATVAALLLLCGLELRAVMGSRSRLSGAGIPMAFATAAVVLIVALYAGSTIERLDAAAGDSRSRLAVFATHWQAILDSPWRGYGLGSFSAVNHLLQNEGNYEALFGLNAMHNVYLQWLEEAGVVGAGLMFGCIAFLHAHILIGLKRRRRMLTWLRAVPVVSLLVLLHGTVDYALEVPSIAWLWAVLLGVGCAVASPSHEDAEAD